MSAVDLVTALCILCAYAFGFLAGQWAGGMIGKSKPVNRIIRWVVPGWRCLTCNGTGQVTNIVELGTTYGGGYLIPAEYVQNGIFHWEATCSNCHGRGWKGT